MFLQVEGRERLAPLCFFMVRAAFVRLQDPPAKQALLRPDRRRAARRGDKFPCMASSAVEALLGMVHHWQPGAVVHHSILALYVAWPLRLHQVRPALSGQ
jgi:hypothetical protein